jgi:glycyl-tRNA synthetase alpha chain
MATSSSRTSASIRNIISRSRIPTACSRLRKAEAECQRCIDANVPLAAYDQAIEASHLFNLLQARGVISVQERASYIGRVRDLAKGSCEAWMQNNGWAE